MKYISFSKKKTSKIKIIMSIGDGKILINKKSVKNYFGNLFYKNLIFYPLILSNFKNFNFLVLANGGGKCSQIFCIKISICKCILLFNYKFKKIFRKLNFFSVDDRMVERKKYGKKKSRKKEQYSKR